MKYIILFITFIFYAFLGWVFEMIHMSITTKKVVNRGFYNGPIVPIYAFGGLIIIYLLNPIKSNFILTSILIILICSTTEYLTSYYMEKMYKIRWWDYSDKPFNLNGRICLETMILFYLLAISTLYIVHPIYMGIINKISNNILIIIFIILFILLLIDIIFSNIVLSKYLKENNKGLTDNTPDIRKYTSMYIKSIIKKKGK